MTKTTRTPHPDIQPALKPDRLYCAYDPFVCVECAGATALATGMTIGGAPVTPLTVGEVVEWAASALGPLQCQGQHLEATVGTDGSLEIRRP
ncbi:hypothetical protein KV102_00340 [Mumia sp. zg.B53]|uniref:hypothetical protein n=1 Tax=Mumia sp. zg.B53 TaxID=2855449 RepID=UPI001C6F44A7|nr:hypothetical protein [Mumia sp. zg.B53]MBW9213274.1 hypothetical protein [Mumia sp. zg.B53]